MLLSPPGILLNTLILCSVPPEMSNLSINSNSRLLSKLYPHLASLSVPITKSKVYSGETPKEGSNINISRGFAFTIKVDV